jgi:ATP-dependent Clp protease adaptor protein ClpS
MLSETKISRIIAAKISGGGLDGRIYAPTLSQTGGDSDEQSGVATVDKTKVKRPRRYKVLLHNDDYTTMEFVIYVLQKHFGKNSEEAYAIMLKVHHEGVGVCGVYTYEIAETKVQKVSREARSNGHPLLCTFEPE